MENSADHGHSIANANIDSRGEIGDEKKNALTQRDLEIGDPEVRNETETTHKGEFGTKRDLVSCFLNSDSIGQVHRGHG